MADDPSVNVGVVRQVRVMDGEHDVRQPCEARVLNLEHDAWQPFEVDAVFEMAMMGRRVCELRNGQTDATSREGWRAVRRLLRRMCRTGDLLGVRLSPRGYRLSISEEILTAWTSAENRYSALVFSVCIQGWQEFTLNNQVFCLSEGTMRLANELSQAWASTRGLFWDILRTRAMAVSRLEVLNTLEHFDYSWVAFELSFLMECQVVYRVVQHPLDHVTQACGHVTNIIGIYARFDTPQDTNMEDDFEYQEQHRLLVDVIVRLNFVANPSCQGIAFKVQLLNELEELVDDGHFQYSDPRALNQNTTFILAADAVEAFHDLCLYLKQVRNCIGSLDPSLENNTNLVERLVRWDATWTTALEYLLGPLRRRCLETLVAGVRWVQTLSPEFVEMCEECGADMFLALPRLM